jgi:hypothetical protein
MRSLLSDWKMRRLFSLAKSVDRGGMKLLVFEIEGWPLPTLVVDDVVRIYNFYRIVTQDR